jgi:hypothetical protein
MKFSTDYTQFRIAVLTDDVIDRLIRKYKEKEGYDQEEIEKLRAKVKKLNEFLSEQLPGKEDLVTEWMLSRLAPWALMDTDLLSRTVEITRAFFTYNKTPSFKNVIQKYEPGINPKNLMEFSWVILNGAIATYEEEMRHKSAKVFPEQLPPGSKLFYDDGAYKIIEARDRDAVCNLGLGTSWCTRKPESAESYLAGGMDEFDAEDLGGEQIFPLYIIYLNDKRIAQMYLNFIMGRVELKNVKNKNFVPNEELGSVLWKSGLLKAAIDSFENVLDGSLTDYPELLNQFFRSPKQEIEKYISNKPYCAIAYAIEVMKSRWPAVERMILQKASPASVFEYWGFLFDDHRWPEAEKVFEKGNLINDYLRKVGASYPEEQLQYGEEQHGGGSLIE